MAIIDQVLDWLGLARKAQAQARAEYPDVLLRQADAYRFDVATGAEAQARLYANLTWIATAVDHVADGIASNAEFDVLQKQGEEEIDIPNHPFELLLDHPNEAQGKSAFIRDVAAWFKLTGNAYIYLNRESEDAPPDEMWVLPSTKVSPVPDGRQYVSGYTFDAGGQKIPLALWQICHIKTYNPINPFVGMSAIQSLAMVGATDIAEQKWNLNLFAQDNAKLAGALAFADRYDDAIWRTMKQEAAENWGGTARKGPMMLRGVGAGGVQWISMSATQKEMEFLQSRQFTKEEIYSKLAPGLASILAINATEANATAGKAIFLEFGLWPLATAIAEEFSIRILPAYGPGLVCECEDFRESNRQLELQEQQEYSKTHTIAEIRHEYYSDEPLGDERDNLLPQQITAQSGAADAAPDARLPEDMPDDAPQDMPMLDMPMMDMIAPQAVGAPQTGGQQQAPDGPDISEAGLSELKAWETFHLKRLGKGGREFETRYIDAAQAENIRAALKTAQTPAQVRAVFSRAARQAAHLVDLGAELRAVRTVLEKMNG